MVILSNHPSKLKVGFDPLQSLTKHDKLSANGRLTNFCSDTYYFMPKKKKAPN
jgi:hypothetical protein